MTMTGSDRRHADAHPQRAGSCSNAYVSMPSSKLKVAICRGAEDEGYIGELYGIAKDRSGS